MKLLVAVLALAALVVAAEPDGATVYKQRCAICHDVSGETRAPAPAAMRLMSPENIVRALDSGLMKEQGAALSAADRRTVAEFLTGKSIGRANPAAKTNACED